MSGPVQNRTQFQRQERCSAVLRVWPHTVHTHCERLYRKLAVTDRVKLVLRVMDEFLALTVLPESALDRPVHVRSASRLPYRPWQAV